MQNGHDEVTIMHVISNLRDQMHVEDATVIARAFNLYQYAMATKGRRSLSSLDVANIFDIVKILLSVSEVDAAMADLAAKAREASQRRSEGEEG